MGTETWYYVKRCFISLLETLAKQMMILKDSVFEECLGFLEQCEAHGKEIPTINDPLMQMGMSGESYDPSKQFVNYEARALRQRYLELID